MLYSEYLNNCADDILKVYQEFDETIIKDICQRIAKINFISPSSAYQIMRLQEAGMIYNNIITEISKASGISIKKTKKLFKDAGVEALKVDDGIYKEAGLNPLPFRQSKTMVNILQAGLIKTNGVMKNLTMTTAVSSQNAFIESSNLAYIQVTTGAMDYKSAIYKAVKNICDKGIKVLYPSGRSYSLYSAMRSTVLTGVNQTCGVLQNSRANEMGCDLVETTAHAGARPEHAVWQGKVFSLSGKSDKYPDFKSSTGYGEPSGLCGCNCRHSYYPFFEGLSDEAYPREKLNEYLNKTVMYKGEKISYYEATQKQRELERNIRGVKRMIVGVNSAFKEDPNNLELKRELIVQNNKLKFNQNRLRNLLKETGLTKDPSRFQYA